ncbi:MAG: hypothetical protein K6T63_00710 [Alicyclobacillus herbarius]|uniref:hypothetical protein n=1 Tax=Alicyclobacillus herbarius TaxID=122960 RepID=UPI0023533967|nr:hypothetical protein [Alicyclobacillus herbarius]MCL6631125.1 hypothetical protein [Alicyclobacillus herbarius]
MKQVPLTLVLMAVCLVAVNWPSIQTWATANMIHHYLAHGLYLIAGACLGLQTSRWLTSTRSDVISEDTGVSS